MGLLVLNREELMKCPDAQSCLDVLSHRARDWHDIEALIECMYSKMPPMKKITSKTILRYRQVERYVQAFEMKGETSPTSGKKRSMITVTKVKSRSRERSGSDPHAGPTRPL